MIGKILGLFKAKEPYWNEFYLKNIDGEFKSGGFDPFMQNIESEGIPFETRENVRLFISELTPEAIWDDIKGTFKLKVEGEDILIELGTLEHISGVTVGVKCLCPPKNAVEIANTVQEKYSLKISGWGNNPHIA